jgi:hypothetical protein
VSARCPRAARGLGTAVSAAGRSGLPLPTRVPLGPLLGSGAGIGRRGKSGRPPRRQKLLERELKRSLIMPRPAECIRSILRMLDAAYELLRQPTDDRNPYSLAAGIAVSLVDGYRRALAELGAPR